MRIGLGRIAVVAFAALGLVLGGCSAGGILNKGGDTTCGDFTGMETEKQDETIKRFLEDEGTKNPPNAQVSLERESAKLYCGTIAGDADRIRGYRDLVSDLGRGR